MSQTDQERFIQQLKREYGEVLALERERAAVLELEKERIAARKAQIDQDFQAEFADELQLVLDAECDRMLAEQRLRTAVEEYCKTFKVKTIDGQLGASETVKYSFDKDRFTEWCAVNAPVLISRPVVIDEKAATAMVKGLPELPPGVTEQSKWSARLTKVAEWFAGTQAEGEENQ